MMPGPMMIGGAIYPGTGGGGMPYTPGWRVDQSVCMQSVWCVDYLLCRIEVFSRRLFHDRLMSSYSTTWTLAVSISTFDPSQS